jgi:hypothetical protein
MTALTDLTALVANLPGASLISQKQYTDALAGALMPDASGVWPGNPGYVETQDIYFAALSLIGFLQAQPVVRQSSSEGTSVAVDAPNWSGLLAYYRGASPICGAMGGDLLRPIYFDNTHVHRTDMSGLDGFGGRTDDDNVDTDLG